MKELEKLGANKDKEAYIFLTVGEFAEQLAEIYSKEQDAIGFEEELSFAYAEDTEIECVEDYDDWFGVCQTMHFGNASIIMNYYTGGCFRVIEEIGGYQDDEIADNIIDMLSCYDYGVGNDTRLVIKLAS